MEKRCFLVMGPESSGNRLLASILIRAGCLGKASTLQPVSLLNLESDIVVIRSMPHGVHSLPEEERWFDIEGTIKTIKAKGFDVVVLVPVRHPYAVGASQLNWQHSDSPIQDIQRAYRKILRELPDEVPYLMVPTEALMLNPIKGVSTLLRLLSLPERTDGRVLVEGHLRNIENSNEKHYDKKDTYYHKSKIRI